MSIQGFYTNKGRTLAAKVAAGTTMLTITRVVAGSGHTTDIPSATALPDIKQTLTVGTATAAGATATLPATLSEASAASSYSLTELGVYATDPDVGEILMQVYQLSAAQAVTAGGEEVLRFFLRQSIGAQGVSVTCAPAGTLIDEDLAPTRSKVMASYSNPVNITVAASELVNYINTLPRMLTERYTVTVTSGTISERVNFYWFYGSGSLTVKVASGHAVNCTKGIYIMSCSALIDIYGFSLSGAVALSNAFMYIQCSNKVMIMDCSIDGTGVANGSGIRVSERSAASIYRASLSNLNMAVQVRSAAYANFDDCSGSHNTIGVYTDEGGIALLTGSTPNLFGGNSNIKGGPIFKEGTLL